MVYKSREEAEEHILKLLIGSFLTGCVAGFMVSVIFLWLWH